MNPSIPGDRNRRPRSPKTFVQSTRVDVEHERRVGVLREPLVATYDHQRRVVEEDGAVPLGHCGERSQLLKRGPAVARQDGPVRVVVAPNLIRAQLSANHHEPDVTVKVVPGRLSGRREQK